MNICITPKRSKDNRVFYKMHGNRPRIYLYNTNTNTYAYLYHEFMSFHDSMLQSSKTSNDLEGSSCNGNVGSAQVLIQSTEPVPELTKMNLPCPNIPSGTWVNRRLVRQHPSRSPWTHPPPHLPGEPAAPSRIRSALGLPHAQSKSERWPSPPRSSACKRFSQHHR